MITPERLSRSGPLIAGHETTPLCSHYRLFVAAYRCIDRIGRMFLAKLTSGLFGPW